MNEKNNFPFDAMGEGEGSPITVRYIFKWLGGTMMEFSIGENIFEGQPIMLSCMSEEDMQKSTVLRVEGAPDHFKGEWKLVFDEQRKVTVKYFPTPEEEEEQKRIQTEHDKTMDIVLMCASL